MSRTLSFFIAFVVIGIVLGDPDDEDNEDVLQLCALYACENVDNS
jgi:hypothetical protein